LLESAEGGSSEDRQRNRASDGHSPTGERRVKDKSGQVKKAIERGVLTFWKVQRRDGLANRKKVSIKVVMRTQTKETNKQRQTDMILGGYLFFSKRSRVR
jgi:hypothetical protein